MLSNSEHMVPTYRLRYYGEALNVTDFHVESEKLAHRVTEGRMATTYEERVRHVEARI